MDFDDSGIDSDPKLDNYTFTDKNEPIISFSPDRCRYDLPTSLISGTNDTVNILSFATPPSSNDSSINVSGANPITSSSSGSVSGSVVGVSTRTSLSQTNSIGSTDLHRRLEKRIARANSTSTNSSWTTNGGKGGGGGEIQNGKENQSRHDAPPKVVNNSQGGTMSHMSRSTPQQELTTTSTTSLVNLNALQPPPPSSSSQQQQQQQQISNSNNSVVQPSSSSSSSGFDGKKVPTLLPPQRLAIPNKSHHSNLSSANEGSSSEHKPLVQWESDESEEELSFFPAPRSRGILNENLSIDNMSLSGEEDDLHLSPPRPLSQRCPCDPRLLFDSSLSNGSSVSSTAASSSPKHCCIS